MLHDIDGVEEERSRVLERPELDTAVPLLAFVEVETRGVPTYSASRLRSVLEAVYDIAAREDFDEELPTDMIPSWFVGVCRRDGLTDPFALEGSRRYTEQTSDDAWELQDWLSRFDPELEARGWAFWDLTYSPTSADTLRLWLDTWGEPFFAWEELRWLLYTCGAYSVATPTLVKPHAWKECHSV